MHCICGCVRKRDSKRTNKNGAWHAHWASNLNLKLLYCCASRLFHLRYQRRRRRRQQQRWQTGKFKMQRERELERRLLESNVTWRESESEWALASSRYVCMYVCISERKQNWTRVRERAKSSLTHMHSFCVGDLRQERRWRRSQRLPTVCFFVVQQQRQLPATFSFWYVHTHKHIHMHVLYAKVYVLVRHTAVAYLLGYADDAHLCAQQLQSPQQDAAATAAAATALLAF